MNDENRLTVDPDEINNQKSRMALKKEYQRQETRGWILSLVAAVVIALMLRFFVFEFIRVDGSSMEPTLYTNEYVFMEKVSYWFDEPELGDIVICSFPHRSETFVKRVIGVGGDTLRITDGVLYINGEPNTDYYADLVNTDMADITVPENHVFVMGDNRNHSMDSRNSSIGALSDDAILGKAVFVLWPLREIHGL